MSRPSFREAVVDVLIAKAIAACADLGVPRLLLGGGVVANAACGPSRPSAPPPRASTLRIPPLALCTDNGAMIAALGARLIAAGHAPSSLGFGADSTLPVTDRAGLTHDRLAASGRRTDHAADPHRPERAVRRAYGTTPVRRPARARRTEHPRDHRAGPRR